MHGRKIDNFEDNGDGGDEDDYAPKTVLADENRLCSVSSLSVLSASSLCEVTLNA